MPAALTDFLLNCCTILFATTMYSSAPQVLLGLLVLPVVATLLQPKAASEQSSKPKAKTDVNGKPAEATADELTPDDQDPLPIKPFITTYRGAMMVITCISILAVDFPVFPRRFAKTESFGTSLMDLGVGSFVFAAGTVAARQQLKEKVTGVSSFVARFKTAMRHSLPLIILGVARLYTVKGLDYPEHVSEYGVHWNFFFTLALLPPAIAILLPILRFSPAYGLVALIIGICYETALTPDMKSYLILAPRHPDDWLSQNREGVYSFIGYLAIFIAGMGIGTGILPRDPEWGLVIPVRRSDKKDKKENDDPLDEDAEWLASVLDHSAPDAAGAASTTTSKPAEEEENPFKFEYPQGAFFFLLKWSFIWFILTVWLVWTYGPQLFVSRRMANLPYVAWVSAFNTTQLFAFCIIEWLMFPDLYKAPDRQTEARRIQNATSRVLHAFNRNGLALFLLANLLTGGINMSVKTLYMDDISAMVVLVGYIGVLCATALMLDHYDISIKL